ETRKKRKEHRELILKTAERTIALLRLKRPMCRLQVMAKESGEREFEGVDLAISLGEPIEDTKKFASLFAFKMSQLREGDLCERQAKSRTHGKGERAEFFCKFELFGCK